MAVSCFLVIFSGKDQGILFASRSDESRDAFLGGFLLWKAQEGADDEGGLVIHFASFWVSYRFYFIGAVGEVGIVIMSVAILVSSSQSMGILFVTLCFDVKL